MGRVFVDEFLDRLSGNSVKLYLYLLCQFENGGTFYEPTARQKLRFSVQEYEAAVKELNDYGIIRYEKGQFLELTANENLLAGKKQYINAAAVDKTEAGSEGAKEYKAVLDTVNKEFFDGRMSIFWFNFCEKCLKEYEFQPETIYLLFHECDAFKDRSSSGYSAYVAKVAETWYQNRVKTPEDLAALSDRRNKKNAFVLFVRKKLNFARNFTSAETEAIASWLDAGITEEMLSVVLDDKNRVSAITIEKIDRTVKEWQENGIKTPEQAAEYKKNKKKAPGAGQPSGTQVHFGNEREYTDDYLNELLKRDSNGDGK